MYTPIAPIMKYFKTRDYSNTNPNYTMQVDPIHYKAAQFKHIQTICENMLDQFGGEFKFYVKNDACVLQYSMPFEFAPASMQKK